MVFSMRRTSFLTRIARVLWQRLPHIFLTLFSLWLGGLIWYAATLPEQSALKAGETADGIVVLTGGQGRIAAGLEALTNGNGQRLLISGVNQELANDTIRQAIDGDNPLFDCCIDFGREALNTRGNAVESAEWAEQNGFASLLVVTTDYHMPRSLLEFQEAMPNVRLIALPVREDAGLWLLIREYNKYLLSLLRIRLF